jgi:hypothetical protein
MPRYPTVLLAICLTSSAQADAVLEYLVNESASSPQKPQPVLVKDGQVLVKGAGGDAGTDVLYSSAPDKFVIIDHRKKTFMSFDERQVNQISRQTGELQPLLQGLGEQIGQLSPQQRGKWEQMLGGNVSLDKLAEAAAPAKPTRLVRSGNDKTIAGFACERIDVIQGKTPTAEFCLADPAQLKLPENDYATIRSLLDYSERLAEKTQGLAKQFGVNIPPVAVHDFAGVPIEMRDLSNAAQPSLTLSRIVTSSVSPEQMQIPGGYRSEQFSLWK